MPDNIGVSGPREWPDTGQAANGVGSARARLSLEGDDPDVRRAFYFAGAAAGAANVAHIAVTSWS